MIALGEVKQVIPDCLSGAGGEASFRDNAKRAIEISQTLTVAEGISPDLNPIGIILLAERKPSFSQSLCPAQILILKIRQVFPQLKFSPSLNLT